MATKVSASYIDSLVHSGSYVRKEIQSAGKTLELTINKETGKMYVVYNKRGESGFGSVSGMDIEPKVLATSSEEDGSLVNLEFDEPVLRSLSSDTKIWYNTDPVLRNGLNDTINKARAEVLNKSETLTTWGVPYTKVGRNTFNSKGEHKYLYPDGDTNTTTEGENPNEQPTAPAPTDPGGNVNLSSIAGDFTKDKVIGAINRKLIYRYPSNMPEDIKYDYIKIVVYEYKPLFYGKTLNDVSNNANIDLTDSISGNRHHGKAKAIIILPMVPTISESNSVGWGEDRMNEVQKRFGALAGATTKSEGNVIDDIMNLIGGAVNIASDFANDKKTKDFLSSYFAGQAVQASGLIQRMGGIAINNNLELLFNGPNLRTFNFNFQMRPRSEDEAIEIRDIIRIFKKAMAPEVSESNLFLKTPDVFEIKYIHNESATKSATKEGQDQPYLNKIKTCAMQSFNVNYVPDGSYMTYDGGSMTGYNIDMSFKELLPIYANDMDKNEKSTTGY